MKKDDFFKPPHGPDSEASPRTGGCPEGARWMLNTLMLFARNEGIEVASSTSQNGDLCRYCVEKREIWVDLNLPWPQHRWYLAVGLGYHFTRHHHFCYEKTDYSSWDWDAEAFATSLLANLMAQVAPRRPLPNNVVKTKAPPRPPHLGFFRKLCRGTKKDGSPCPLRVKGNTAYCHHHQEQSKQGSFSEISELVATLGSLLE